MSELAIVSSKRVRLENLSENGHRGATAALKLADDPSRFLSTVQVGITLISIFNGAFGEASLVEKLSPQIEAIPALAANARNIAFGVVVVGITFASILLGELVPKRIAMKYPETIAAIFAVPVQWLSMIMAPFVKLLTVATEFFLRVLNLKHVQENSVTQEDIAGLIKEGTVAGVLDKTEQDIVTKALHLDDVRLASLMTPRADIVVIDLNDSIERNLQKLADAPYTRFPVCRGKLSNMIGILHSGDLFAQIIRSKSFSSIDVASVTKPAVYVPEILSAMQILESLRKHRSEVALTVDEYGEIAGMITLSDIMSCLVGDVAVLGEEQVADAVQREDGSWLLDGGISLERFCEVFGEDLHFPGEGAGTYHTLAGFILNQLGHIPHVSQQLEWDGYHFEVVDMDQNRIDRVLAQKLTDWIANDPEKTLKPGFPA